MACLSIDGFLEQTGRILKGVAEVSIEPGALAPSLCEYGCTVALRAVCPHGCPSVAFELLIAGHTWGRN
jgi:hypothetical protein